MTECYACPASLAAARLLQHGSKLRKNNALAALVRNVSETQTCIQKSPPNIWRMDLFKSNTKVSNFIASYNMPCHYKKNITCSLHQFALCTFLDKWNIVSIMWKSAPWRLDHRRSSDWSHPTALRSWCCSESPQPWPSSWCCWDQSRPSPPTWRQILLPPPLLGPRQNHFCLGETAKTNWLMRYHVKNPL